MRDLLLSEPDLHPFLARAEELRLQILLGWIEADAAAAPHLRQIGFRADAEYFYPASTVKLFGAIAALEELARLRRATGYPIDRRTDLVYYPLFEGETIVDSDPTHLARGTVTVEHEIRKLFLVSDNEAFNRLYELVGPDRIAASLRSAGLERARIVHRLAESRTPDENRRLPRIDFRGTDWSYSLPERLAPPFEPADLDIPGLQAGRAYLDGAGRLVSSPFDFSGKNRFPLVELQQGLCKLVRPDCHCGPGGSFDLEPEDHAFLVETMRLYPAESSDPVFDPREYPDSWGKNLLPGLLELAPRQEWRIHNKTGRAYGFSIENAWVVSRTTGRAAFLAATIYTNADGVLNDDRYEYSERADPFFRALGRALGRWLLQ